jgi:hypothetical protein
VLCAGIPAFMWLRIGVYEDDLDGVSARIENPWEMKRHLCTVT